MALYSHNNQTVEYHITPSVLPHDVLLLQGAQIEVAFWQPVLQQLKGQGGRLVTCQATPDAESLLEMLEALGLEEFRIVALGGDAVAVATEMHKKTSLVENTLLYASEPPRIDQLVQAIREL